MRIAVPFEGGMVYQHFGHTEQIKVYDVENGKIVKEQVMDTQGHGHGALAGFLSGLNVQALICGGIGGGARMALAEAGITLYGGVSGNADEAVKDLLAGELEFDPNIQCSHHGHENGHACGEGSCGSHGCHGQQ